MSFWEVLSWVGMMLLSVYGCAQVVRSLCLWLTRCPRCVECCRLAIPQNAAELAPMVRCLQSQAVWDAPVTCRYTLVVLPQDLDCSEEERLRIFEEAPRVIPVTCEELTMMVQQAVLKK